MKLASLPICLLFSALAGCNEPTDVVVSEPEARTSSRVSLYGFSLVFPVGLTFDGATETCPNQASECPLADDSTHLVWRSGDLRFDYVVDPFGAALADDGWGDPITINGRPAFRKHLDDGGTRYLITNHYGGEKSAAVATWQQEEEPIFWGTCRSDKDCDAVLQTLASVSMRSAESEDRSMSMPPPEERGSPPTHEPAQNPLPPLQVPPPDTQFEQQPAPPPPGAPRPAGAEPI